MRKKWEKEDKKRKEIGQKNKKIWKKWNRSKKAEQRHHITTTIITTLFTVMTHITTLTHKSVLGDSDLCGLFFSESWSVEPDNLRGIEE